MLMVNGTFLKAETGYGGPGKLLNSIQNIELCSSDHVFYNLKDYKVEANPFFNYFESIVFSQPKFQPSIESEDQFIASLGRKLGDHSKTQLDLFTESCAECGLSTEDGFEKLCNLEIEDPLFKFFKCVYTSQKPHSVFKHHQFHSKEYLMFMFPRNQANVEFDAVIRQLKKTNYQLLKKYITYYWYDFDLTQIKSVLLNCPFSSLSTLDYFYQAAQDMKNGVTKFVQNQVVCTKSDQRELNILHTLIEGDPQAAELFYQLVYVQQIFQDVDVKEYVGLCFDELQTLELKGLLRQHGKAEELAALEQVKDDNLDYQTNLGLALNFLKVQRSVKSSDSRLIQAFEELAQ